MFSRRHYVALAQAFREVLVEIQALETTPCKACQRLAVSEAISEIAVMLSRDNPRFDFDRFTSACGVGE